jgi:site-specific DNA-methyltransferase (adenine-specific)
VSTVAKPILYGDTVRWGLIQADALLMLARLPENCIDAIVTDPPYGIGFKGEAWDGKDIHQAASTSDEWLGAAKAFERWTSVWAKQCQRVLKPGGHLLAFGAPRTFHRLVAGVEDAGLAPRDQLLWLYAQGIPKSRRLPGGLGTALKPAYEPVLLARAPLHGSTQDSLDAWGTGALNIQATRVNGPKAPDEGYWPSHLVLSHDPLCQEGRCVADCPAGMIDRARPDSPVSRLFYCAKASRTEREAGCKQLPKRSVQIYSGHHHQPRVVANLHPTVKPIELMRWLVQLVTPPGGIVLDPFSGSGTTGIAAVLENRQFVGIEREGAYVDIACARLTHWAHEAKKSA